jgi:Rrf2 family protein
MKMSAGVEWGIHCCVVMSRADGPVTAARLADFHGVSRTYLAKHLQALTTAGLVRSVEGRDGGYALTRPPEEITLRDVVAAVEGPQPLFRCTEIRQRGPYPVTGEACLRPCGVASAMREAEQAFTDALARTTIADLAERVERDSGPGTLATAAGWLRDVPRG